MNNVKENRVSVEVVWRYDWTAYYYDPETKQRYSVVAHVPIKDDELCKRWMIYKIKQIDNYEFKILDYRIDKEDENNWVN